MKKKINLNNYFLIILNLINLILFYLILYQFCHDQPAIMPKHINLINGKV